MLSPTKRPSTTDESNEKKKYSPAKQLLSSPLATMKYLIGLGNNKEETIEENSSSPKKPRLEGDNTFITSSPNLKKLQPKQGFQPKSPLRKSRNLNLEFESKNSIVEFESKTSHIPSQSECNSSSQEDSSDELKQTGKKGVLNTLFSPFYTLLVPGKPVNNLRLSSEKNSFVSKNELLSSDEILGEISVLADESFDKIHDLYDPYNLSIQGRSEIEEESREEDEDFDPFLFIANLPPIGEIVSRPTVRLPSKKKISPKITLVLDLDETLVHCSIDPIDKAEFIFPVFYGEKEYQVYVRKRPYFEEFLKQVSGDFEVVVFTASQEVYASKLLDLIDPKGIYIHHRLYRDSCVCVEGNYLKDLSVLGRDLSQVVIVDNSPQAFGFQLENGIPIESWFEDDNDTQLLQLLPFLKNLLKTNDVRDHVKEKFKLYEKVSQIKKDLK